jgi:hypothetical protein
MQAYRRSNAKQPIWLFTKVPGGENALYSS